MTRLTAEDIHSIPAGLADYDREVRAKTGRSLLGVACHAAGIAPKTASRRLAKIRAAVIPVTVGQGLIDGFAEAVAAVSRHIGLKSIVTQAWDVAGLAEALERRANWLWLADDNCFVLVDLMRRRVVDNGAATGRGFAAGLDLIAGGVAGRRVAVIGCGPVGISAAETLLGLKARVTLHDIRLSRAQAAAAALDPHGVRLEPDLGEVFGTHKLLLEATPMAGLIPGMAVTDHTYIAAPGVPLGLSAEARRRIGDRLLHDPLPLGVATMAAMALISGK